MEKRSATRKLTETRVVVHHKAFPTTPLKTKDMSQGGVFVTTKGQINLKPGTGFDITFMIALGSITKLRKVAVKIVESTPEGVRLEFQ